MLENLDFEGRKKRCEFRLIGLNTKKNELDTLLNTIKDDDKGLKMLATIDYLDKLIAKCQKDLDIKLERGNINENNREGDI